MPVCNMRGRTQLSLKSMLRGWSSLQLVPEALKKSKAQRATRPNASKEEVASPVGVASPPFRQVV